MKSNKSHKPRKAKIKRSQVFQATTMDRNSAGDVTGIESDKGTRAKAFGVELWQWRYTDDFGRRRIILGRRSENCRELGRCIGQLCRRGGRKF